MYSKTNWTSGSGIDYFEYSSLAEYNLPNFYNFVRNEILDVKRRTGVSSIGVNLMFIDQDSNMRYYSISNLDNLEKIIFEQDLDDIYGGSDGVPNDFQLVLTTRKFRINILDESGGYGYMEADYYTYLDSFNGVRNNDCLIQCFKSITYSNVKESEVRLDLGLSSSSRLGTKHIKKLENYFNVEVCVLRDEYTIKHIKYDKFIYQPRIIYGNISTNNKILYKNNHYGLITKSKLPHGIYQSKIDKFVSNRRDIDILYYFFDYETVYESDTYILKPYSFAIVKCDGKGDILNSFFELNTNNLVDYLQKESATNSSSLRYLIGFNNSRFDNFFIIKEALIKSHQMVNKTFFMNNTILSMMIYGFEVLDLCRILNTSLDNACKSFKIKNQKLSLDHSKVQSMYNDGLLEQYISDNYNEIKEYNLMDVITLSELFFKTKYELKKLCDVNIEDYMTLAGMSYSIFRDLNRDLLTPAHSFNESSLVRQSVYGGRAQMFNKGEHNTELLCCIDCVSLYPYVMLNNVFPIGLSNFTELYKEDKTGVYRIIINNQPNVNIVPNRIKYKALDWNQKNIKCTVTSQDLDMLLKYNCDVEVLDGVYWNEDKDNLFKSYFDPIVKEKMRQDELKGTDEYNGAVRELCKLLMNSLSGKLIQRDYDDVIEIVKTSDELHRFKQKCKKESIEVLEANKNYSIAAGTLQEYANKMPTIYGSLIYSYARSHMYDTILSKVNYNELYGMDTDSAFITKRQYEELKIKYPKIFGDEFGQFKEEILELVSDDENGPYGIFVAPKCYCFYKIDKDDNEVFIKARFKGINLDRDKIWTNDLCFEDMSAKELNELYYGDTLKSINVEFYRKCLASDVMILHSNLSKKIFDNKDYINIKQHFCIKHIKL